MIVSIINTVKIVKARNTTVAVSTNPQKQSGRSARG